MDIVMQHAENFAEEMLAIDYVDYDSEDVSDSCSITSEDSATTIDS